MILTVNNIKYETHKTRQEILDIHEGGHFDLRDMYDVELEDGRILAVGHQASEYQAGQYIVSHYGSSVKKVQKWLKFLK